MSKTDFMPRSLAGKKNFFTNYSTKISGYAATFGLTTGVASDVADATNGKALYDYLFGLQVAIKLYAKALTDFMDIHLYGSHEAGGALPTAIPAFAAGTAPTTLVFDLDGKIRRQVARIKAHPAYTTTVGQDLWLIGTEHTDDPATWQPHLALHLEGGHVFVGWGWESHNADAAQIDVDRGTGTFVHLFTDTDPDYIDPAPLPTTPQVWRYRASYIKSGAAVGLMSDVQSIGVGGAA